VGSGSGTPRSERAARNEAVFRRVNERLEEVNTAFQSVVEGGEFVCECADIGCVERIELTLPQYEALRSVPTHFIVKPGHELVTEERVVEKHEDYLIVEKIGLAGERAAELDPRSD
jgi:hypothetical protein